MYVPDRTMHRLSSSGTTDPQATDRHDRERRGLYSASIPRSSGVATAGSTSRPICAKCSATTGKIGSVYDFERAPPSTPFPAPAAAVERSDPRRRSSRPPPARRSISSPTRSAGRPTLITTLSYDVNGAWNRDRTDSPVTDLRKAIANDPKMQVMIAHGWDDLVLPVFRVPTDHRPDARLRRPQRVKLTPLCGWRTCSTPVPTAPSCFKRDAMRIYG